MERIAGIIVALGMLVGTAGAEPYDATNGYAASGFDVVAYFSLPRVGASDPPPPAIPGRASLTAEYDGATYAFSTGANRDAFLADPERYAPQFGGHCAFGVSRGVNASGNPTLWRIDDGRLYFNGTQHVYDLFRQDIPGNLDLADRNWEALELEDAASDILTAFDPASAPVAD